jgi:hypothetical protein
MVRVRVRAPCRVLASRSSPQGVLGLDSLVRVRGSSTARYTKRGASKGERAPGSSTRPWRRVTDTEDAVTPDTDT